MKGLRIVAEGEVEDIGFGDGNAGRRDDLAGIVIFVVSLALRHGGSLSQTLFGKEIADVVDEGLRLFHRHEMAALRQVAALHDLVATFQTIGRAPSRERVCEYV